MKQQLPKATSRRIRIFSLTLTITSLLLFLVYTWNDYTEHNKIDILENKNIKSNNNNNDINIENINAKKKLNDLLLTDKILSVIKDAKPSVNPMELLMDNEHNMNSIRVYEQISSVRKELDLQASLVSSSAMAHATRTLSTQYPVQTSKGGSTLSSSSTSVSKETKAAFEVSKSFSQMLNIAPMVLFIKSSDKDNFSNNLKKILTSEYEIQPQLAIVDLDKHQYGNELERYIKNSYLSKDDDLPYLFINGISALNNYIKQNINELHSKDLLAEKINKLSEGKILFKKLDLPSNS